MTKGSIQEGDIVIINIYALNIEAPQHIRQMLRAIKGEKSEINYKREKAKQRGWEYRSTQKRRNGKRNGHEKTEVIDKQGLENT